MCRLQTSSPCSHVFPLPPSQKHLDAASLGLMASDDADADVTGRLPASLSATAAPPFSLPPSLGLIFKYGVSRSTAATSRTYLFLFFLSFSSFFSYNTDLSSPPSLPASPPPSSSSRSSSSSSSSRRLLTHRSDLTLHHTQRRCRGAESTSPPADSPCMDAPREGML